MTGATLAGMDDYGRGTDGVQGFQGSGRGPGVGLKVCGCHGEGGKVTNGLGDGATPS